MFLNPIPSLYRFLAAVLFCIAFIAFGYVQGLSREADRRDAQDLKKELAAGEQFDRALSNGKKHAAEVIAWRRKANIYYRNWQERLNHENDSNLATCTQGINSSPVVWLGANWLSLYNAAWFPEVYDQSDTGGAAYSLFAAGAPSAEFRAGVTPREVLENVYINADLCAEDRKRHDELIAHLRESEK